MSAGVNVFSWMGRGSFFQRETSSLLLTFIVPHGPPCVALHVRGALLRRAVSRSEQMSEVAFAAFMSSENFLLTCDMRSETHEDPKASWQVPTSVDG